MVTRLLSLVCTFGVLAGRAVAADGTRHIPLDELLELPAYYQELYSATEIVSECSHYLSDSALGSGEDRSRERQLDATEKLTLLRLRGVWLLKTKEPRAALDDFRRCVQIDSKDPSLKWLLARALAATGETEQATTHCKSLNRSNPDFAPAYATLAVINVQQKRPDDALALLAKSLELDSRLQYAYFVRAGILASRNELRSALADITRALTLPPDEFATSTASLLLLRGQIQLGAKSFRAAAADFTRVIQLEPNNRSAHYGCWRASVAQGKMHIAARSAEQILRLSPDKVRSLKIGAMTFSRVGQPERALTLARRWVEKSPESIEARVHVAGALRATGQDQQAIELLDQILRESPNDERALTCKCWLLLSRIGATPQDARGALEIATTLRNAGASGYTSGLLSAAATAKLGDFRSARDWLLDASKHARYEFQILTLKRVSEVIRKHQQIQIAQPPLELL